MSERGSGETADREVEAAKIARFWPRTGAAVVDSLVLGAIGWVIAMVAYDELVQLGGAALLIGFVAYVSYFTLFDARFGPSPGKRFFYLQVVDRQGRRIASSVAAARATVLAIPYFLNGAPLPEAVTENRFWALVLTLLVFGAGGSALYLYLFNRTTRQGLHDLLTDTFVTVTRGAPADGPVVVRTPRWHRVVAAGWPVMVLCVFGGFALAARSQESGLFADLEQRGVRVAWRAVQDLDGVRRASVQHRTFHSRGAVTVSFYLQAWITDWPADGAALSQRLAVAALDAGLVCPDDMSLQVVFTRGFSTGIASHWRSDGKVHTCGEWREAAKGSPAGPQVSAE